MAVIPGDSHGDVVPAGRWLYAGLQYCCLKDRPQHGYEHPKVIFPPGAVDRSVIPKGASSLGLS